MVETSEYWFAGDATNRARRLSETVDQIIASHSARWAAYQTFADLYRGYSGSLSCKYAGAGLDAAAAPLSLNVLRSCVDTAVSKIATKNQPKAMFVTDGASYDVRMTAMDTEDFVKAVMHRSSAYPSAESAFQDATTFGEGFAKTYSLNKEIRVDRLHPWEVIIDETEGRYGEVPSIYHSRYHDKFALARAYPERRQAILEANPGSDPLRAYTISDAVGSNLDMLRVVEGWRTDERHTIAVNDIILVDEPWEGKSPINKILWGVDPVADVFGCGLGEQLRGLQIEVNALVGDIQEGHALIKGYLALHNDSEVVTEKINNDLRRVLRYGGQIPPQYVVPQIIAAEVYQHLWQLVTKMYELSGIAQIDATGTTAEGLTSSVGQRTFSDKQTERFLKTVKGYENFVMGIAGNVVRVASNDMSVRSYGGTRVGERIDWTTEMSNLDAEIRCYPGSMLPDTPAGRMSWAQDMLNLGVQDPGDVLETIGVQDPDGVMRRMLAARFVIQRNISSILRKKKYVSPEPSDDHKLALKLVNAAYHEARLDDAGEERLGLLLKYMQTTQEFIARDEQGKVAAQGAPAVAPPPPQLPQQGVAS